MVQSEGFYTPDGITIFSGGNMQELIALGGLQLKTIIIDKIPGSSLTLLSPLVNMDTYPLTIEGGELKLNGNVFRISGDININSDGILNVDGGSWLSIGSGLFVNTGGLLKAIGSSGNPASIHRFNSGYYALEVISGGTISAEYAHFEDMNSNGIKIYNGGIVDEDHAFNHSVIDAGQNVDYAIRLRLYNDQILTCTDVNFPNNPGLINRFNVGKPFPAFGNVTFVNASGSFSGHEYEADPIDYIDWTTKTTELEITVMLEGAYNGSEMNTGLKEANLIPPGQPFNISPWNYSGTESTTTIPPDAVDWVLVELRDAMDVASATHHSRLASQAGFLLQDGSVKAVDGLSNLVFNTVAAHELYAIAWHRNHLGVMSANPLNEMGGVYSYNFTLDESMVYGGDLGHKNLNPESPVYTFTAAINSGTLYYYKFINDNDWPGVELVPAGCGVPDDSDGNNRVNTAPEADMVIDIACFSSCNPCGGIPIPADVTFQVDMTGQTVSPDGVHIAGTFQGWDPAATEMMHQGNNIYAVTLPLNSGEIHRYKFINGNNWGVGEYVPNECGLVDFSNDRVILIPGEDILLTAVCFGSCNSCGSSAKPVYVTFRVDMTGQIISPNGVHVTGSFQGWDPETDEMTPGIWGMIAGDGDANGEINLNDKSNVWVLQVGQEGYEYGDFNLDGQVDNPDKNDILINNIGTSSQVPD